MTYTIGDIIDGATVIWPELDLPAGKHIGAAIVIQTTTEGVTLLQGRAELFVPYYGVDALIAALIDHKRDEEFHDRNKRL